MSYPENLDTDTELYLVHDGLRVRLAEDYVPGDTSITIEVNDSFEKFPDQGIITLTEQCSEVDVRAISFKYTSKGEDSFNGLTLLDGFTDSEKSKIITNVTQNVMSEHHNAIKDSLISVQTFVGVQGTTDNVPLGNTMEGRINFLRNLVLKPKAWFTVDKKIGIAPLCINFSDFSTRQPSSWTWDFGDGDTETITRTDDVLTGNVTKCYNVPGTYTVSLYVVNDYGENELVFDDYIVVREEAPDEATLNFIPLTSQVYDDGVLRSRINQVITVEVDDSGEQALDPIIDYTWEFGDDYSHDNTNKAKALYSVGGIYDIKLRADTELGAYRITTFENVIDIVEKYNIWHFIFDPSYPSDAITKTLYAYEFGLISETYKTYNVSSALSVTRDCSFSDKKYKEFRRNNGVTPRTLTSSGDKGKALAFWAEDEETIRFKEFDGFNNLWTTPILGNGSDNVIKDWNWLSLSSVDTTYFVLGAPSGIFVDSPTDQSFTSLNLSNLQLSSFSVSYENGADELEENIDTTDNYSVYRGVWRDSTGYFARNDGAGEFFRIKSFYGTEGTVSDPFQTIRKLTDMPGTAKLEGQFVNLSKGLYFFNNTGEILLYNVTTDTWTIGGPGVGSSDFSLLQDQTVTDYDDESNSLIAVSDGSSNAYLMYDYSVRAQIKFNEIDGTLTSMPLRANGEQFGAILY